MDSRSVRRKGINQPSLAHGVAHQVAEPEEAMATAPGGASVSYLHTATKASKRTASAVQISLQNRCRPS
jgi:hypothetical protein